MGFWSKLFGKTSGPPSKDRFAKLFTDAMGAKSP